MTVTSSAFIVVIASRRRFRGVWPGVVGKYALFAKQSHLIPPTGFSATIVMSGARKEMERPPSADQATSHERRASIEAVAAPRPAAVTVVIYDPMTRATRMVLANSASSFSVKTPRQGGLGLGDHPMNDCCRRLNRADHIDRFPGVDYRGIEIPGRRCRRVVSALGLDLCFQCLLTAVPFSAERIRKRTTGVVARPIHRTRPVEHRRAKRVVPTAGDYARLGCGMRQGFIRRVEPGSHQDPIG